VTGVVPSDPQHRLDYQEISLQVFDRILRQHGQKRAETVVELLDFLPDESLFGSTGELGSICRVLHCDVNKPQEFCFCGHPEHYT
jgi:hypothetical protein